jgi:hypothetical protein
VSGETVTSEVGIGIKKSLKKTKGQSESVYRRRTDNTMAIKKRYIISFSLSFI